MTRGAEIARLVLRGVVGSTMIAHGVRHGRTLDGTAGWFERIGFRQPELQARLSSVMEVGAGGAILAGAATPAAGAAVIGTMAVAARTVHLPNGFFVINEGYEHVLAVAGATAALSALGPGRYSVDNMLGLATKLSGPRAFIGTVALGLGGAAVQLATFWRKPSAP